MKLARLSILAALALLLASCNGSSSGGGSPFAPTFGLTNTSTSDPAGDQKTPAPPGTNYDILLVQTSRLTTGATQLFVTITFAQPVLLPAAGGTATNTQLGTLLAFNVGSGGATLFTNCAVGAGGGPASYPGISFITEPNVRQPAISGGGYRILTFPAAADTGFQMSVVNVSGNSVIFSVPLAALGGGTGATQMGVWIGNDNNPTDCAPNSGTIST